MSFIAFVTVALALFTQSAQATAIAGKLPVSDVVLVASKDTAVVQAAHSGALTRRQTTPSTLLICTSTGCGGTCDEVALPVTFEECFTLPAFVSVAVLAPAGEDLPYGVFVGPAGCGEFAQIPETNTCFNTGSTFSDFFLNN